MGKIHYKSPFSIAMLVYQRVNHFDRSMLIPKAPMKCLPSPMVLWITWPMFANDIQFISHEISHCNPSHIPLYPMKYPTVSHEISQMLHGAGIFTIFTYKSVPLWGKCRSWYPHWKNPHELPRCQITSDLIAGAPMSALRIKFKEDTNIWPYAMTAMTTKGRAWLFVGPWLVKPHDGLNSLNIMTLYIYI